MNREPSPNDKSMGEQACGPAETILACIFRFSTACASVTYESTFADRRGATSNTKTLKAAGPVSPSIYRWAFGGAPCMAVIIELCDRHAI
jgi:hypothetical protein